MCLIGIVTIDDYRKSLEVSTEFANSSCAPNLDQPRYRSDLATASGILSIKERRVGAIESLSMYRYQCKDHSEQWRSAKEDLVHSHHYMAGSGRARLRFDSGWRGSEGQACARRPRAMRQAIEIEAVLRVYEGGSLNLSL